MCTRGNTTALICLSSYERKMLTQYRLRIAIRDTLPLSLLIWIRP